MVQTIFPIGPVRNGLQASALACLLAVAVGPVSAADRTTLLIPRSHDSAAAGPAAGETNLLPRGTFPDRAFGQQAGDGWKGYIRVWKAHYEDPSDRAVRRFLGLPLEQAFQWSARRGRSAPRWLNWSAGSYAQIDTAHFVIYSRAGEAPSRRVAEDLERCYWAWTQMFFPLWEASAQVSSALAPMTADQSVSEFLSSQSSRITLRRKLRVVLFRDVAEYQKTLSQDYPGVERSTGFYANDKQTIFLYASDVDDAATRRHELVHQLFREATRSGLGRDMPGEQEGFWLVEGIAGYFESLLVDDTHATVGGWDASRLQFARYRTLVLGDVLPIDQLRADGRLAAQQRQDLARWYAHSIAQTHRLLDGGDQPARQWVYGELAKRYKIRSAKLPSIDDSLALENSELLLRRFLVIDDDHLNANLPDRGPTNLVLAECRVSPAVLQLIPPSPNLVWLDLTRIPVNSQSVFRLAPEPESLQQLRLEATRVGDELVPWLRRATNLSELDLSWTPASDAVIGAVAGAKDLSVLFMTGTKVTDASIEAIVGMTKLQTVDVQRTGVTEAGLARLRAARPEIEINPLQLR